MEKDIINLNVHIHQDIKRKKFLSSCQSSQQLMITSLFLQLYGQDKSILRLDHIPMIKEKDFSNKTKIKKFNDRLEIVIQLRDNQMPIFLDAILNQDYDGLLHIRQEISNLNLTTQSMQQSIMELQQIKEIQDNKYENIINQITKRVQEQIKIIKTQIKNISKNQHLIELTNRNLQEQVKSMALLIQNLQQNNQNFTHSINQIQKQISSHKILNQSINNFRQKLSTTFNLCYQLHHAIHQLTLPKRLSLEDFQRQKSPTKTEFINANNNHFWKYQNKDQFMAEGRQIIKLNSDPYSICKMARTIRSERQTWKFRIINYGQRLQINIASKTEDQQSFWFNYQQIKLEIYRQLKQGLITIEREEVTDWLSELFVDTGGQVWITVDLDNLAICFCFPPSQRYWDFRLPIHFKHKQLYLYLIMSSKGDSVKIIE